MIKIVPQYQKRCPRCKRYFNPNTGGQVFCGEKDCNDGKINKINDREAIKKLKIIQDLKLRAIELESESNQLFNERWNLGRKMITLAQRKARIEKEIVGMLVNYDQVHYVEKKSNEELEKEYRKKLGYKK